MSMWHEADRRRIVERALTSDPMTTHLQIALEVGCSRETVRKVRAGLIWTDVLPELPRERFTYGRRCWNCKFISRDRTQCDLGIPESVSSDGRKFLASFAVKCSSYMDANEPTP